MRPFLSRRRVVVWGVVVLATLAFAVHTRQRVVHKERTQHSTLINDFARWLVLGPRFLNEHADFVDDNFPNPPVTLLFLVPFLRLSPANAQFAWVCGKALMAGSILFSCRGMVRRAGVELTPRAITLIVAVWLAPLIGDIQEGQTNLLMLLPLVAGLAVAQRERAASDWLAGLLIALAVAIKVTPLIFLPYALLRKRWHLALAIGLGLVLWLLVVPGLAFGWQQNLRWLDQWSRIMILPYVVHGEANPLGQSIPSLLTRLLRHVPALTPESNHSAVEHYLNVVDWPETLVNWLGRGGLLALAIAGIARARHPLPTLRSRRYVLEIGAIAAFMLWASERTWVPHYVTLVLTLSAVGMILDDPEEPERIHRRAWWALVIAASLMVWTGDLNKLVLPWCGQCGKVLGVSFWASVLLVWTVATSRSAKSWPDRSPVAPA